METLYILLVLVFLPLGWFIRWALRHTQETVGDDSPLRRQRTYQFSASHYFGSFIKVLIAFTLLQMILLTSMMAKEALRQQDFLIFLLALLFGLSVGFFGFYFYFDWLYWQITRDVSVTFNPEQATLEVNGSHQYCVFSADDVVLIEEHVKKTSNPRDLFGGYGYYRFFTSDGNVTQVNNIFFENLGQFEFMERHFSNVPKITIQHRLPWPT